MSHKLNIVMYHYVRDLQNSRYPAIKGLDYNLFKKQIETFMPLLEAGIRGIDRLIPIGRTMEFDYIWDGYNLAERLTRVIGG